MRTIGFRRLAGILWRALAVGAVALAAGATAAPAGATSARPAREVSSCNDTSVAPPIECFQLFATNADNQQVPLTDDNGQPIAGATITSGSNITVEGWNWNPSRPVQIWLSAPLLPTDSNESAIECRTVLNTDANGFLTNPFAAVPAGKGTPHHPDKTYGAFVFSFPAPEVADAAPFNTGAKYVLEVASPDFQCPTPGTGELQAFHSSFIVTPVARCDATRGDPCLRTSPLVVQPGQPLIITGENFNLAGASSAALYLYSDPNNQCAVPLGTVALTAPPAGSLTDFTVNANAPPLLTLPPDDLSQGITTTQFHVLAVALAPGQTAPASCATGAVQSQTATFFVTPPSAFLTTRAHLNEQIALQGQNWLQNAAAQPLSAAATTAGQPTRIAVFVGPQASFSCASATVISTQSNASGAFSDSFAASLLNTDGQKQVRVAALPSTGATPDQSTLRAICQGFDNPTCQSPQPTTSACPLMGVKSTIEVLAVPPPVIDWLPVIVSAALLLLLLPLFFFLGRRAETEVVITEQDVTVERQVYNQNSPVQYADASFSRVIRVTRSVINVETKKVIDQEIEEYDVFKDAQGREVRRLRPPRQSAATQPSPRRAAPATT